jgi:flagellar hook-length control protein FliK
MDLGFLGAPALASPPQAGRPGAPVTRPGVHPAVDPAAGESAQAGAAGRSFADTLAAIGGPSAPEETSDTFDEGTVTLDVTGVIMAIAPVPAAQEPAVPIALLLGAPAADETADVSDAAAATSEQGDAPAAEAGATSLRTHAPQDGFATQIQAPVAASEAAVREPLQTDVVSGDSTTLTEVPTSAPATTVAEAPRTDGDPTQPTLPANVPAHAVPQPAKKSMADAASPAEYDSPRSAPAAAQPNPVASATPRLDDGVAWQAAAKSPEDASGSSAERGGHSGERRAVSDAMSLPSDLARARRALGESLNHLNQSDRQRANQETGYAEHRTASDRGPADLAPWMQSSAAAAVSIHAAALPLSVISPAGQSAAAHMFAALTIAPAEHAGTGVSDASPTLRPASDSLPTDTTAQIIQALRLQRTANGGTAQIRLEPHHFGALNVSIRVEQGQVIARLEAEAPVVREWLQTNQSWLRSSLADQNLTLDRLEIAEAGSARHEQRRGEDGSQQRREDQQRPRRRRADTGELFEVVA